MHDLKVFTKFIYDKIGAYVSRLLTQFESKNLSDMQTSQSEERESTKNPRLTAGRVEIEEALRALKFFKKGDRVEFHTGGVGTVVFVSQGDYPICTVLWNDYKLRGNPANSDDPAMGKNMSISLPAIDTSPRFNPIIRKYENKKLSR